MNYTTWIELNRSNLEHNIIQYQKWLPKGTAINHVIKANAYGHGLTQIASIHEKNPNLARLCVVNTQEALELRNHGIKKPILVLGYINSELEKVITNNIDITVYDQATIKSLNTAAQRLNKVVTVHLKVDTGMSRFGICPTQLQQYVNLIKNCSHFNLQGIWTHLSCSNDPQVVHQQEELFKTCHQFNLEIHIANSLGSLNCKYQYDSVRIGSGLYGYLLTNDKQKQQALKPVLSLKTKILHVKQLSKGSHVGYQRLHTTTKPTTIAILGIGYHDGINSKLVGKAHVIIHGKLAPIISINMNFITVDITHIPDCQIDDTVTVLGKEDNVQISAYDWQKILDKNIRECLTNLERSLPRIIVNEPTDQPSIRKKRHSHRNAKFL